MYRYYLWTYYDVLNRIECHFLLILINYEAFCLLVIHFNPNDFLPYQNLFTGSK